MILKPFLSPDLPGSHSSLFERVLVTVIILKVLLEEAQVPSAFRFLKPVWSFDVCPKALALVGQHVGTSVITRLLLYDSLLPLPGNIFSED